MGESLVETPILEKKMGDSVTHVHCLQESVSFGRFENDSLCWERWSTFPTNKYLEEVEKCSTPGSVAEKKAYFEAHYKKIAARKVELFEAEKKREFESEMEDQTSRNPVWDTCEEDLDVEKSNTQNCSHGTELVNEIDEFTSEVSDKHIDIPSNSADVVTESLTSEVTEHIAELSDGEEANEVGEHNTDVLNEIEELKDIQPGNIYEMSHGTENIGLDPPLENANEDLHLKMEIPELTVEPVLVTEHTTSSGVWQDKEVLPQQKIEERKVFVSKGEIKKPVELIDPMKKKKSTLVKKATYAENSKKKPASPIPRKPATLMPKSPMTSTPKSAKADLTKTAKSTTRPGDKQKTGYTPLTSKKGTTLATKRVLPTSLHMSLSYGPPNSDPASHTTMRKSLIMERMGDKDIVKRAFKAFQNVSASTSSVAKPAETVQSTTKRIESKVSTPDSIQKKKEGITRSVKATSSSTGQQGTRKPLMSPGSKKNIGMDQRNDKVISASFGSRSLDHGRQHKQVPMKVELKSNIKDAGKTHIQSKLKAEEAAEIGKPSLKVNSKPKLSSSYNQGHGFLRGSVLKEDAKI